MQQAPDDGLRWTFQDLHHLALGPATAVMAHHAHLDAVLVQHGAHFIGGEVDIGVAVIPDEETMAVPVALNGSFHFFQQVAGLVHSFVKQSLSFLECPGGAMQGCTGTGGLHVIRVWQGLADVRKFIIRAMRTSLHADAGNVRKKVCRFLTPQPKYRKFGLY